MISIEHLMRHIIPVRPVREAQGGFTLIELLLYTAIVGTLLIAVTGFFAIAADSRIKNQSISEVDQQGTLVMNHITRAVRNASSITAPTTGATEGSLILAMPTANVNPTNFSLTGEYEAIEIQEGASATVALTNSKVGVSNLIFKNLTRPGTPGLVQISFTISRLSPNAKNEYSYQKTFSTTAALR